MTKKILFWIDDSLIHFGIANSLQENLNYQLYSIISVANKKENFFKKQNLKTGDYTIYGLKKKELF